MKCATIFCAIGAIWLAGAPGAAAADTNAIKEGVAALRPLTIDELLRTTATGTYQLSPGLTGRCAVVFATGIFKQPEPPLLATNRYKLRFDVAVVTPKRTVANVGPRGIARFEKDGGFTALHTLRDTLAADSEIQSATRAGALEKLLGATHDLPRASLRHWRYFSVNGDGSVDALQVAAVVGSDERVESLEILRGTARPDLKPRK